MPPDTPLLSELGGGLQTIALSADASRVAFVGRRPDGRQQIFLRRMDLLAAEPVVGTEDGGMPFFSPDGEWLGFASEGKLKKVPIAGGQPVVICDAPDPRGASWGADGTILFPPQNAGGLYRVAASGGTPQRVTTPDPARAEDGHRWPQILPGDKAALFSVQPSSGRESERRVEAVSLASGERHRLVTGGSHPQYADGYLFYGRAGELLAAPFDPERLALLGEARPVLGDVRMDPKQTGRVDFDVTPEGTLVYVPGFPRAEERSLVFMDRQGRATPVTSTKRAFFFPAVSPDGGRLAVGVAGVDDNMWVLDLSSDTLERVTFEGDMGGARWSPNGRRLLFSSNLKGARGLFSVSGDGSDKPELFFLHPEWWINTFSPHPGGAGILLSTQKADGHDLLLLREAGGETEPFLATTANEQQPAFSPDGRLVAYVSDESGRYQVYLRPFPGPGRKRQVSVIDGIDPRWRRDGKEIFFFEGVRLMAVAVEAGTGAPPLQTGAPLRGLPGGPGPGL